MTREPEILDFLKILFGTSVTEIKSFPTGLKEESVLKSR